MKAKQLTQTAAALLIAITALAGCKKDKDPDPVRVTSVSLSPTTLELAKGETAQLTVAVLPADAENRAVTWSISDVTIAVIADNGEVIAMNPGTATITATTADGGFRASCTVTVKAPAAEKTPVSIAVTTQPAKKTYAVGEAFDPAEMVVTATYSDETTAALTVTAAMLSYDFSTAGADKTVTITYEGKTATVTGITVTDAPAPEKTLVSIAVTAQPAKKTYAVGEAFDPAGMVVTATYSDETTAALTVTTDNFAYDFSTAGANKTVTITYEGKTATVTGITVTGDEIDANSELLLEGIYDTDGELLSSFEYDAQGRLIKRTILRDGEIWGETEYKYNNAGEVTEYTGVTVARNGNTVTLKDGDDNTVGTLALNNEGLPVTLDAYGTTTTYTYNVGGNVTGIDGFGVVFGNYDSKKWLFSSCASPQWLLVFLQADGYGGPLNNPLSLPGEHNTIEYEYEYNVAGYPVKRTTSGTGFAETFTYRKK
ncbi:MAG: bacterial Ig-like domain-containing protein [Bacteroidales bacterium]|jgi:YD repeat-containing protein|nr:bacterial Ig-like domain-containing protein [Bacteroidales bacterium]